MIIIIIGGREFVMENAVIDDKSDDPLHTDPLIFSSGINHHGVILIIFLLNITFSKIHIFT
jgi:hypothetical protein